MSTQQQVVTLPRRQDVGVGFAEMERLAESVAKCGLFGIKTKDQALALMAVSQAEGRHPALAARDYDIIQGRPAKKAEAMLRDFLESGGRVEWHALDDAKADATFTHPSGGTVRITWDMERVKLAGMAGKDMYKKYPRQMLRSRVVSEGVRTVYPAATSGMYVPEEVNDFAPSPAPRDVTPSPIQPAPTRAPFDPATGEVKPHQIAVGYVTIDGRDAADWPGWGRDFIAAIMAASSLAEIGEWETLNQSALVGCSENGKRAYTSVSAALAKAREKFREPDLATEADAASALSAS